MAKAKIEYTEHYAAVMKTLVGRGLLLGAYDAAGKGNLMTIGWGSMGSIWSMPLWTVLVRPSRYTYGCIEHSGCFTVNVPGADLADACAFCGGRSGRDVDKFAALKLAQEKAHTVSAPCVSACPIVYECQVVHSNDVLPARLAREIAAGAYAGGDYHRVYFGKILAVRAEPDAPRLLSQVV